MKMAKVVDAHDVRAPAACDPWLTDPAQRARIEELLRIYPSTTEAQTEEIRLFLTRGKHYDVGVIAGSDEFREKVIAFREAHNRDFRLRPYELIGAIILGALMLVSVWYYAF